MEAVGEIIERLVDIEVSVKCLQCGAIITMVGKQYTARCHQCGTFITLTPAFLAQLKLAEYRAKYRELEERPRCDICRDRGYVILREQEDDLVGEFVYRCLCQAGQKRKEAWPVVPAAKVMAFTPRLNLVQPEPDAEEREEKEKAAGGGWF